MLYGNSAIYIAECVKVVSRNGRLKSSSKQASQLSFHFPIQALGMSTTHHIW